MNFLSETFSTIKLMLLNILANMRCASEKCQNSKNAKRYSPRANNGCATFDEVKNDRNDEWKENEEELYTHTHTLLYMFIIFDFSFLPKFTHIRQQHHRRQAKKRTEKSNSPTISDCIHKHIIDFVLFPHSLSLSLSPHFCFSFSCGNFFRFRRMYSGI